MYNEISWSVDGHIKVGQREVGDEGDAGKENYEADTGIKYHNP